MNVRASRRDRLFRQGAALVAAMSLAGVACGGSSRGGGAAGTTGAVPKVGLDEQADGNSAVQLPDVGTTSEAVNPAAASDSPSGNAPGAPAPAAGTSGSAQAPRSGVKSAQPPTGQAAPSGAAPAAPKAGGSSSLAGGGGVAVPAPGGDATPSRGQEQRTASDVGVTPSSIKFGGIHHITGPFPFLGYSAYVSDTFLKWQNDKGGLNGRKFQYVYYDDSIDNARAVEEARRLIDSDKIFAFYGNGTALTQQAINQIADPLKIPGVGDQGWGPGSVASEYVFHTGLRTTNGGHLMAQMAEKFFRPAKPSMVSTDIDLSQQCANEPRRIYKKLGRPIVADPKTTVTEPDYTPYVLQLRQSGTDMVFFCIDPSSLLRLFRAMQRQNYKVNVVAVHANYDYGFRDSVGSFANGLVIEAGPQPIVETGNPRSVEFKDVFLKYNPDKPQMIHSQSLIPWAGGFVLMEALRRAGINPTRTSLHEALKSIKQLDWGFGPAYTADANRGWVNYDGFKVARDPVRVAYAVELRDAKFIPKDDVFVLDESL